MFRYLNSNFASPYKFAFDSNSIQRTSSMVTKVLMLTLDSTCGALQLEHCVERVEPVPGRDGGTAWQVVVRDLLSGTTSTSVCDAVLVCNG